MRATLPSFGGVVRRLDDSRHLGPAIRFGRAVRYVTPAQLLHRLRLRAQMRLWARWPEASHRLHERPMRSDPPGWPDGYVALEELAGDDHPSAEANAVGQFRFLGEERHVDFEHGWSSTGAPQLWMLYLHSFDWAWSFIRHSDSQWASGSFGSLWSSWRRAVPFGSAGPWGPYATALRAWNLCATYQPLVSSTELRDEFLSELGVHLSFMRRHLELDVLGNHLVKDLKAVIGLAIFLREDRVLRQASTRLSNAVHGQILADGGHIERSPSYHCQVLGDLIDVTTLVSRSGRPPIPQLSDAIERMGRWLGSIVGPGNRLPQLQDCQPVSLRRLEELTPQKVPRHSVLLADTGYATVRVDDFQLIVDIGGPGPPNFPGHAHAGALGFELTYRGHPVLVDTGASTYEPTPRRQYERSTQAHNTVEVDGTSQTETWDRFRVGRRARCHLEQWRQDNSSCSFAASHDGYRFLPGRPCHRRRFDVSPEAVVVTDEIAGQGCHEIVARLHFAPGTEPVRSGDHRVFVGNLQVTVEADRPVVLTLSEPSGTAPSFVAEGFGRLVPATVMVARVHGTLPIRLVTNFTVDPERAPA